MAIAGVLLFSGLGDGGLRGDEGFYGLVVADLLVGDDPTRLTLENRPFLNKPPLAFWWMALSARMLGLSEYALRLPGAVVSLALTVLIFTMSRRRVGVSAALAAVLLFVSTRHSLYFHGWRSAVTEPWLAYWTLLSVLAYFRIQDRRRRLWTVALLSAANSLTKGLVGPVLCAATLLASHFVLRSGRDDSSGEGGGKESIPPLVLFLTILAPATAVYLVWWLWNNPHPEQLLGFLRHDWLQRATGNLQESHIQGPLYFVRRVGADFGLWLLFLIPSLRPKEWRRLRTEGDQEGIVLRLFPWISLVLFSLPVSKIAWYIYPAYSFLALTLVESARNLLEECRWPRWVKLAAVLGGFCFLGIRVLHAYEDLPRPVANSLVTLAKLVDARPGASVFYDQQLLESTFRPREWNRFTLFHRLGAEPWRAESASASDSCVFLVSPSPTFGPRDSTAAPAVAVPVARQARSRPEPPLFVIDRCASAFADLVLQNGTDSASAPGEPD